MPLVLKLYVPISGPSVITVHEFSVALSILRLCTTVSASRLLRIGCTCAMRSAARKQRLCPSNTRRCSRQLLVMYHCLDRGGG